MSHSFDTLFKTIMGDFKYDELVGVQFYMAR